MDEKANTIDASLEKVIDEEWKYNDYEYPRVSIVVPTYNCSEKISLTLDSLLRQHYPDFEIIIVDAASDDRTLEVVKNYRDDRIHVYSVSAFQRYEMLNKGISQSTGDYLNCLFPGDYYIHSLTLQHMMELALDSKEPELVYCGTLIRDGRSDPKILYRPLSSALLRNGQQPTSLQSCWFKLEAVRMLGKFNTSYTLRGGYELMCRFLRNPEMRSVSADRVYTDYDLRHVSLNMVWSHFWETLRTVYRYFGLWTVIRWLFIQKDFSRLMKMWLRTVKAAIIGR